MVNEYGRGDEKADDHDGSGERGETNDVHPVHPPHTDALSSAIGPETPAAAIHGAVEGGDTGKRNNEVRFPSTRLANWAAIASAVATIAIAVLIGLQYGNMDEQLKQMEVGRDQQDDQLNQMQAQTDQMKINSAQQIDQLEQMRRQVEQMKADSAQQAEFNQAALRAYVYAVPSDIYHVDDSTNELVHCCPVN